jgi:hypothetical protein
VLLYGAAQAARDELMEKQQLAADALHSDVRARGGGLRTQAVCS